MEINAIQELAMSWGILLIPIIVALVSLIKVWLPDNIKAKAVPGITTLIGIVCGFFVIGFTKTGFIVGILTGLSAGGLYSNITAPTKKIK